MWGSYGLGFRCLFTRLLSGWLDIKLWLSGKMGDSRVKGPRLEKSRFFSLICDLSYIKSTIVTTSCFKIVLKTTDVHTDIIVPGCIMHVATMSEKVRIPTYLPMSDAA